MDTKSILFVYSTFSSFVRTDYEILSSNYSVKKLQFGSVKGMANTGLALIKQFLFLLVNLYKYDAVYIWFADYHSFLPILFAKVLKKKSFLVIGGYDVCRIKKLNYGALCSKLRGFFCVRSMYLCTLNLAVSSYVNRKVKYIAPGAKTQLVYNCVDLELFTAYNLEKENLVLTVGIIENERSFFLKGIDTLIEVAKITPEYKFLIIGLHDSILKILNLILPENVIIKSRIPHGELVDYYQRSKYYCQFSRSESFGVSIAESMLYGCIPIVTNEGGMPEVVGDNGFIVSRDPDVISRTIKQADVHTVDQIKASDRIKEYFGRTKREDHLVTLINSSIEINKDR